MIDVQDIKEIADYYGYEEQSNQLIEECAELIQAVNKLRRSHRANKKDFYNLVEEIADVEIMLAQVKHLLGIHPRDVERLKICKIQRQKERMAHGKDS